MQDLQTSTTTPQSLNWISAPRHLQLLLTLRATSCCSTQQIVQLVKLAQAIHGRQWILTQEQLKCQQERSAKLYLMCTNSTSSRHMSRANTTTRKFAFQELQIRALMTSLSTQLKLLVHNSRHKLMDTLVLGSTTALAARV